MGGSDDALAGIDPFAALLDGRGRLDAALAGLDPAAADAPVHGEWRVRDLIAHIAAWDGQVAAFLRAVIDGQREFAQTIAPDDEFADWNEAQVRAAGDLGLDSLGDRLRSAREELLLAAHALDEALMDERLSAPWGFEDTPRGYLLVQAMHDAAHADEIADALSRRGA